MFMNRIAKWAAVGILAIATVPTIGMGRTRASLPSAAVTQTPSTATPVGIKHTRKASSKKSTHKHVSKASAKKHVKKAAAHKKVTHKTSAHKKVASKKVTHKASAKKHVSHKTSAK